MENLNLEIFSRFCYINKNLNGIGLQEILVSNTPITNSLPNTKKKFNPAMLPQETGEVVVDNFVSNPNIKDAQILKNEPAKIGDFPGFKLTSSFSLKNGLKKKAVLYGAIINESYYEVYYEAPALYYFEKDLPTFEEVKSSFSTK